MKDFRFNLQTAAYFGRNCIEKNIELFKTYGSKAVVFTGPHLSGRLSEGRHQSVIDVENALKKEGIPYLLVDEVEIDPPVETCARTAKQVRPFGADLLIGVGGGSSLDTAKAVGVLLDAPEDADPYEVLYRKVTPYENIKTQCKLNVICVPTTAGTASELSPYAVMTRADIHTKLAIFPWVYCVAAFLDPRYVETAPDMILHTGVFDALAHGVESYLHNNHNRMNRLFAEFGFSLFKDFKDGMASGNLSEEDYDKIMLHSAVQGMAFSSTNSSTTLPHGMGYPLSHIKHVNHGLSCAVFLGEYIRGFKDQSLVKPIVEQCGFANSDEFADYCNDFINRHIDIQVTEAELQQWTDDFMATGRMPSNPEQLTRDELYQLYKISLARYIK